MKSHNFVLENTFAYSRTVPFENPHQPSFNRNPSSTLRSPYEPIISSSPHSSLIPSSPYQNNHNSNLGAQAVADAIQAAKSQIEAVYMSLTAAEDLPELNPGVYLKKNSI